MMRMVESNNNKWHQLVGDRMDDWYAEMKDHATSDDESLKQFLTTLRITVPEEIKRHVEAEFHFVYSPQRERGY